MLSTLLTPDYLNTHNTSAMFVSARQRALIIKGERKIREVIAQCNGDYSMDIIASTLYSFISILEEPMGAWPGLGVGTRIGGSLEMGSRSKEFPSVKRLVDRAVPLH